MDADERVHVLTVKCGGTVEGPCGIPGDIEAGITLTGAAGSERDGAAERGARGGCGREFPKGRFEVIDDREGHALVSNCGAATARGGA